MKFRPYSFFLSTIFNQSFDMIMITSVFLLSYRELLLWLWIPIVQQRIQCFFYWIFSLKICECIGLMNALFLAIIYHWILFIFNVIALKNRSWRFEINEAEYSIHFRINFLWFNLILFRHSLGVETPKMKPSYHFYFNFRTCWKRICICRTSIVQHTIGISW